MITIGTKTMGLKKTLIMMIYNPRLHSVLICAWWMGVLVMSDAARANDLDLLKGTDQVFWATFNGTGKGFLYAAEGLLALATYIKTKNVLALVGIVIVGIFINIVLKFAGQS